MRSMEKNWSFKSYSARDDEAYYEFMIEIDKYRIEVRKNYFLHYTGTPSQQGYMHECDDFCDNEGCIYQSHERVYAIDGNI